MKILSKVPQEPTIPEGSMGCFVDECQNKGQIKVGEYRIQARSTPKACRLCRWVMCCRQHADDLLVFKSMDWYYKEEPNKKPNIKVSTVRL